MDKEKIEEIKREMINGLKEGIEDSLLENFVENYEEWQIKLKSVNDVVSHVDDTIELYNYNDFCKKIIEITKNSLEKGVDYDKLFLTESEYFKILQDNSDDEGEMEKVMIHELNKKFMTNLLIILNTNHLKETIKYKLSGQFDLVESELDRILNVANLILRDNEINKEF